MLTDQVQALLLSFWGADHRIWKATRVRYDFFFFLYIFLHSGISFFSMELIILVRAILLRTPLSEQIWTLESIMLNRSWLYIIKYELLSALLLLIAMCLCCRYDRVRGVEIGNKDVKLEYLEEAYTTQNWIVRIYKVKPPKNRWWEIVPPDYLSELLFWNPSQGGKNHVLLAK